MVLLKLRILKELTLTNINLHSTMVLLKFGAEATAFTQALRSTFHYGSIKIQI